MSLTFKFDKLNEKNPEKRDDNARLGSDIERYDSPSHARNICFLEENGKQTFLNYSYLISGEFNPAENIIRLFFTTHSVTLTGNNLEALFEDFIAHTPKRIACVSKRYEATKSESETVVIKMSIKTTSG